ncbi:hypothetical protein M0R45_015169 [Rubus argutus]|uniref:Aminotransferase-like plant mobile domain-containing protein n=1 Tax=Rubus argutus TaxID=59490 RepID=A0AAW1XR85_RUBAR
MIEEKEDALMVSPAGGDPFRKKAYFLKPILPNSSIDEPPFKLPRCFSSLPPRFGPKKWPLKVEFRGWRLDHKDWKTWVHHLASIHQSTWKKAGIYDAILNSTYQIKRKTDLVYGFAEKWCSETNTFIFPWGEATITLEDVMVLGGYSVLGDSIFSPLQSRELKGIQGKLEKERIGLYTYAVRSKVASTHLWMKKFIKSGSELEHEAFLVFWLSRYVFREPFGRDSVNKAVLSIAIRLARGVRLRLAPAVLANIYGDLSLLKRTIVASNELKARNGVVEVILNSPLHLVQVWAWERFLELRPNPNVIICGQPRLARWDSVLWLNVENLRRVLDSAGEGFMWRPYAIAIQNWNFPKYYPEKEEWVLVGPGLDHELLSFSIFLRVTELVGFGTNCTIEQYLPHRVAMQFGYDQDLPCSLAGSSHISKNAKLYIPSRLSEADASMRYLNWWKESVSPYSPKNSEKLVQDSTGRNEEDDDYLVPPGFPPKCNQTDDRDPMDEDTPSISDVLEYSKKHKIVGLKKGGDREKLSGHVQNLVSSAAKKGTGNNMKLERLEESLMIETSTGADKAKGNLILSFLIEEKEDMAMVSPTGGDPCFKKAYFFKPITPSFIDEPPFDLPQCFSFLPSRSDPKKLELIVRGWRQDHKDLKTWVDHLASMHQSTWKKAGIYDAIFNSMYHIKRKTALLCGFADKWCSETNTFIFPWGEATITLEDVMVLGGYSVLGDCILSPLQTRELKEIEDKLEKKRIGLKKCRGQSWFIASTDLWMKKFMNSGSKLEHEAFLVFWLSRYVFHGARDSVNKSVFSIAIRLARGTRIALAPAVLASIYRDLSLLKRTIVASNELNARYGVSKLMLKSPFHLVQVWAWERILELRPKPNDVNYGETRLARWDKVNGLNVKNLRKVLDLADECFMWRPYAMAIENWNFPKYYVDKEKWVLVGPDLDDELLSFAMFLNVAELVGFGTIQQYHPHRVARQFGFDQDLPCSVSGHSHNYDKAKLYIPSRLSEADASMGYLNWWKESVSGLTQKCMAPKKKANKAVDEIYDTTIPFICSPKDSEESVQISAGRNVYEGNDALVPPGFPPKRYRLEAGDPMDDDDLTVSEAFKLRKKLKTVETRKGTNGERLSGHDQFFASSIADGIFVNTMKSEKLEKEVVLRSKVLTWGGKGKRKLNKVMRSKARGSSNDMASIIGKECPSSTSLLEKPVCGSSSSLYEKQEFAGSSSLVEKQECTCSSSSFEKLKCASSSPSFEKRVSELKAKVNRLEKVVQVLKENIFGKS